MKCMLDMMVTDNDYHDNARPSWLTSGTGGGRMEIDRWYRSANVALEFQGPQTLPRCWSVLPFRTCTWQTDGTRQPQGRSVRFREGIQFVEDHSRRSAVPHHVKQDRRAAAPQVGPGRTAQSSGLWRECAKHISNYAAREEKASLHPQSIVCDHHEILADSYRLTLLRKDRPTSGSTSWAG